MTSNEREVSFGGMAAVFLLAGPPMAALTFSLLVTFANRNSDPILTKISEVIQIVFNPFGLLAVYAIWIIPTLFSLGGCRTTLLIARKPTEGIVTAAFIGAFFHFGWGALTLGSVMGHSEPKVLELFIVFAGAGGAVSACLCALIVNVYVRPSSQAETT